MPNCLDATNIVSLNDETVFKKFFEEWYNKLYTYLFKITKSKEIAEELTIDIFLKIWQNKECLGSIQNINAYLFKIAHNKAIDFLTVASRDRQRQKAIAKMAIPSPSNDADNSLLNAESDKIFTTALEKLSPQRRHVFILSRVNGLSHQEIAKKMNISRNTVRNTIAEALKSVKEVLKVYFIVGLLLIANIA